VTGVSGPQVDPGARRAVPAARVAAHGRARREAHLGERWGGASVDGWEAISEWCSWTRPHRTHAALQPHHLHQGVRRAARPVRAEPLARARRTHQHVFLQRAGAVRRVEGAGTCCRDGFLANVSCRARSAGQALQEGSARGEARRRSIHDVSSGPWTRRCSLSPSAAAARPVAPATVGLDTCGWPAATTLSGGEAQRLKSPQLALRRAAPGASSTSSTSPRPGCTSTTSGRCAACSTGSSTRPHRARHRAPSRRRQAGRLGDRDGPGAGDAGGRWSAGNPEDIARSADSPTGRYLPDVA